MSENHHSTGRQIAAGRELVGYSLSDLASSAWVSVPSLRRTEAAEGPDPGIGTIVAAVRRALDAAGVGLMGESGGGAGGRMRQPRSGASDAVTE